MWPTSCTRKPTRPTRSTVDTTKLPPGILKAAVDSGRLHMIVQPAWEGAVRQSITDMMQRAVKAGFYQNMPDDKIIYAP